MSVISAARETAAGRAIGNAFSLIARFGKFFVFAAAPQIDDDDDVDSEGNRKSFLFKCPKRFHKRLRAIPNFPARSTVTMSLTLSPRTKETGGLSSTHSFWASVSRPNEGMSEAVGVVVDACRRSEK